MLAMSTEKTLRIYSENTSHTERIAEHIGKNLKGGEVIELASDLGGGKTTFVKGLARGAGYHGTVASPSYVISREYRGQHITVHHYDFYRLSDAGLMKHELADVMSDTHAVIVVEWGGTVRHILPEDRTVIEIQKTGENARILTVSCPKSHSYMIEGLC